MIMAFHHIDFGAIHSIRSMGSHVCPKLSCSVNINKENNFHCLPLGRITINKTPSHTKPSQMDMQVVFESKGTVVEGCGGGSRNM